MNEEEAFQHRYFNYKESGELARLLRDRFSDVMPLAYVEDGWSGNGWDPYLINKSAYCLALEEDSKHAVLLVLRTTDLTPGFFSLGSGGTFYHVSWGRIPDALARGLSGRALSKWIAESPECKCSLVNAKKHLGDGVGKPFAEEDWKTVLDTPAIERWNRRRLTGFAGGPPSGEDVARAHDCLTARMDDVSDMKVLAMTQEGDVKCDGLWEVTVDALDRMFGPGWHIFERFSSRGAFSEFLVRTGGGEHFVLNATCLPQIWMAGFIEFQTFAEGDPKPLADSVVRELWPEDERYDATKSVREWDEYRKDVADLAARSGRIR